MRECICELCLMLWMYLFCLSRVGEKHLWKVTTVHHWLLQYSFFAELCKKAPREPYQRQGDQGFPLNFSTWLPMSPWVSRDHEHHVSPAKPPASTRWLIWLVPASYSFAVKPYPTHPQRMPHNFSYSLKSQKPPAAHQPKTQPTNSCSGPQEAKEYWILAGSKWEGVFC